MSATAGKLPRQSDAEAAVQLTDMAADMMRVLPILERQNPELAQKIRKAGFDRPQQLAHIIDFYANQVKEKEDIVMRFATFVDEIIMHARLFDWCQGKKREIYASHGIAPDRPAPHPVEMKVYDFLIETAKEALGRREQETERAFNRCLASIEEIVDCLGLRGWYNEQKENLLQKNGVADSPAGPERVMELYPLAITKIKEELGRRNEERGQLAADAKQKKELEARLAESTQTVSERDKRLNELLETCATLEAQRNQLLKDNESLQKQLEELKSVRADYDELTRKVADAETALNDYVALKARIAELEKTVADRDDTIKSQTQRLDELGGKYKKLEEISGKQVKENEALQKENAGLQAALRDYNKLKKDYDELVKEHDALKKAYAEEYKETTARFKREQEEKDERIIQLEQRLARVSTDARKLAFGLDERGDYEGAALVYTLAIITAAEDDPKLAALYYNRATALEELRLLNMAASDLEQVLRIDPNHINAQKFLADVRKNSQGVNSNDIKA